MAEHIVEIGPEEGDGTELTILRGITSHDDPTKGNQQYVEYICRNVTGLTVESSWDMGSAGPNSHIGVEFDNGHKEYFYGVVIGVEGL